MYFAGAKADACCERRIWKNLKSKGIYALAGNFRCLRDESPQLHQNIKIYQTDSQNDKTLLFTTVQGSLLNNGPSVVDTEKETPHKTFL